MNYTRGYAMQHFIHHVPGRLRIKNPVFKSNPRMLQEVQSCFEGTREIKHLESNPLTSSLVLYYDPHVLAYENLLQVLQECEYLDVSRAVGLDHHMSTSLAKGGQYLGKVDLSLFMDWALAGSSLSYITCLI